MSWCALTDQGLVGELTTGCIAVRFHDGAGEQEVHATLSAHDLEVVEQLAFRKHLYLVKGRDRSAVFDVATGLSGLGSVLYAEPELVERLTPRSSAAESDIGWHLRNVRAKEAWAYSRGAGSVVAVVDKGFHLGLPVFAGSLVPEAGGFLQTSASSSRFSASWDDLPRDQHGTGCAGIAIGRPTGKRGYSGIAPEAGLLPIACGDAVESQFVVAQAVAYAAAPRSSDRGRSRADVLSCSLGTAARDLTAVLRDALEYAGENGREGLGMPVFWSVANDETPISQDKVIESGLVIAIGRSDRFDRRAACAFGPELAFLAPGQGVFGPSVDGGFIPEFGASYSAPCAAGVGALLLSIDPSMTATELTATMQVTCDPVEGEAPAPNPRIGAGRVNAHRAAELTASRLGR